MSLENAIAAYKSTPGLLRIKGVVQHYDWGGYDFIPGLLGMKNPDQRPFAELWIGAHPSAPSSADLAGEWVSLDQLIDRAAEVILGPNANRFAQRLPYLLKILDARQMLSIQAHPTREQAQEGFAWENAAGISLQAPNRNYKDNNHKPEVHVGLGDFWMLHGFRPLEEIAALPQSVPEWSEVMPGFAERLAGVDANPTARKLLLRDLYSTVMTMPQNQVDAVLNPLIARLQAAGIPPKITPDYWVLRAAENFPLPGGRRDRGIFSIYLLNLVHLTSGEGTYQPAGMLHAYLEGANVELMANSDNVLRGGLTPKHVDLDELMRTLTFEDGKPEVITGHPISAVETVYRTPVDEFELSRIQVCPGQSYTSGPIHSADALIVVHGSATVKAGGQALSMNRGGILLAPYGVSYTVEAVSSSAALFKASIPEERDFPAAWNVD